MKSILKILSEYIEEARLSDLIGNVRGNDVDLVKHIEKERDSDFIEDRNLPTQTTLKKRYNKKKIKVWFNWYDTENHNLITRIINRTNFKSVDEFGDVFINVMNIIFPDYLEYPINQNGRYGIYVEEYNISIVFSVRLNNVMDSKNKDIHINVITILTGDSIMKKAVKDIFVV